MSNSPSRGGVHVNKPLTNISIAYMQDTDAFVADKVFPMVPVDNASDVFYVFSMGDFNRDEARLRAPATESAGGDFDLTTDNYSVKVIAFHKDIAWQIIKNADQQVNLERAAVEYVTRKMLIAKERQWATAFFQTGIWATNIVGDASGSIGAGETIYWNDYTNSNPILDVTAQATIIGTATGYRPNTLVLGRQVFDVLKNHPDFLERINGGATIAQPAQVQKQLMASIFEVDQVLVMDAIHNTAKKGQTAVNALIGGKNALLVYAAPEASLMAPSGGYTFMWDQYLQGADSFGVAVDKFEMRHLKADRVEGEIAFDQKLTGADLGSFFSGIVQ